MSTQPEPIALNITGNAKSEASAIAAALEKNEQVIEANKEVLRELQAELKATKARAKDLAEQYGELKDETLRAAAKTAFEEARADAEGLAEAVGHVKAQQKAARAETVTLKENLKAAKDEAKKLQKEGADAIAKALKDADEQAKKLSNDLDPSKAKKVADELERGARAGKGGSSSGFSVGGAVTSAAGNLAAAGVQQLVAATTDWIRSVPEGAAAAERHQRALAALGGAYQQVQSATRGTVTAEQAYAVQQRLTESGLRLNGAQLAAVTGRARDYARSVGIDVQQALDQLTEGLNAGTSEGLRRFGITVQAGATRTETFVSALRQLEAQEGRTAHAAVTVAEAQDDLSRALTEANHSFQAMLAEKIGLQEFFTQTASWVRELTDGTRSLSGELHNVAGAFHLVDDARNQSINQSASGAFVQQASAALDEARRQGVDVTGLPPVGTFAINATPAQRAQFLNIVRRMVAERTQGTRSNGIDPTTQRAGAGLFGGTSLAGVRDLGAENGITNAARDELRALATQATADAGRRAAEEAARRRAEQEAQARALREQAAREAAARVTPADADAVRAARLELERVRADLVASGFGRGLGLRGPDPTFRFDNGPGVDLNREDPTKRNSQQEQLEVLRQRAAETQARRGENELARLQRLTAATQAYQQAQLEQATRERTQATEALALSVQRTANALQEDEQRRTHEQEALAQRIAMTGTTRAQIDANNALAESEHRGAEATSERIQQLGELRTALRGLLEETNARIAQAEAEGRSQAEINQLIQQRIGLQSQIAQASREQSQATNEQNSATTAWKDSMVGALGSATDAFAAASIAALDSGKSFGDAMREMLRSVLLMLAKQSIVEGIKNLALGFSNLAMYNYPGAVSAFTAAALWGVVGVAAGVGASAIPKASAQPSAVPSQSSAAPRAAQLGSGDRGGASSQPLQINVSVSGALMTSEQVQDGIVRGLDHAHARGVIPRFLRPTN